MFLEPDAGPQCKNSGNSAHQKLILLMVWSRCHETSHLAKALSGITSLEFANWVWHKSWNQSRKKRFHHVWTFEDRKLTFWFPYQATVVTGDRAGPDAELGRTGLRNGAVTCRHDRHMQRLAAAWFMADFPDVLPRSGRKKATHFTSIFLSGALFEPILGEWIGELASLLLRRWFSSYDLCCRVDTALSIWAYYHFLMFWIHLRSMNHATGQNLVSYLDINIIKLAWVWVLATHQSPALELAQMLNI